MCRDLMLWRKPPVLKTFIKIFRTKATPPFTALRSLTSEGEKGGTVDRRAENVGEPLHGPVGRHHAAVDPQNRVGQIVATFGGATVVAAIGPHGIEEIKRLEAHALERGARKLVRPGVARQSE